MENIKKLNSTDFGVFLEDIKKQNLKPVLRLEILPINQELEQTEIFIRECKGDVCNYEEYAYEKQYWVCFHLEHTYVEYQKNLILSGESNIGWIRGAKKLYEKLKNDENTHSILREDGTPLGFSNTVTFYIDEKEKSELLESVKSKTKENNNGNNNSV